MGLSYYTMLKVIPNKNAGFIILLTSILILLLFGESRRLNFNSNFYNIHFFLIIICFLWIGAQLPQEIFISYGRILTLFYYFIIIYLLFVFLLPFHLYYNLQLIYWHFIELLWLFIYTILYSYYSISEKVKEIQIIDR